MLLLQQHVRASRKLREIRCSLAALEHANLTEYKSLQTFSNYFFDAYIKMCVAVADCLNMDRTGELGGWLAR